MHISMADIRDVITVLHMKKTGDDFKFLHTRVPDLKSIKFNLY